MRRLIVEDEGITVTELMIVTVILSFAVLIVGGLMSGLLRDWQIQEAMASVQEETRPVVRELLVQVRQSTQPESGVDSNPVSEVAWDRLTFYADRLGDSDDAPERHEYELINCSGGTNGGLCDLQLTITSPDNPSAVSDWTYTGTPDRVETVLEGVRAEPPTDDDSDASVWLESEVDDSLFHLVRWDSSSGTATREIVGACDDSGSTTCVANLVVINLVVDPGAVRNAISDVELYEEVRLRNA